MFIKRTKHGFSKKDNLHPLYTRWANMIQRCCNPNNPSYKYYGRKGIKINNKWRVSFKSFYDWCMDNGWEGKLEIDRIDNSGDYTPDNCRIVSHAVNSQNRDMVKLSMEKAQEIRNTKLLIPEIPNKEIAEAYGVGQTAITHILNNERWI